MLLDQLKIGRFGPGLGYNYGQNSDILSDRDYDPRNGWASKDAQSKFTQAQKEGRGNTKMSFVWQLYIEQRAMCLRS